MFYANFTYVSSRIIPLKNNAFPGFPYVNIFTLTIQLFSNKMKTNLNLKKKTNKQNYTVDLLQDSNCDTKD